jgi:hypothetical protein
VTDARPERPLGSALGWLRARPALAASLWTTGAALLALVDLLWLRSLHEAGTLDRVAAAVDDVVFLMSLPGIVIATGLVTSAGHHHPPAFYPVATAVNAALLWPLLFIWLRHRRRAPVKTPGRRAFLVRGAGVAVAGLMAWAVWLEPRRLVVRRLRFPVRDLPPALDGLRVLHLTDLHLGPFVSEARLRSVIDEANALRPDLVALTGDHVHGSPAYIPRVAALLGRLRPRLGVVGVLGNHDHWEGADASRAALRRAGVVLVENRHMYLGPGGITTSARPGALCVGGVGDLWEDSPDLDRALAGVDPRTPRLLLCHHPDYAERPSVRRSATRVDLMLSGHTHGGQVSLPALGPPLVPSEHGRKYARGLVAGPRFPVHVSAGVGVAVLPVRLGVPPEMTLITLVRRA